MKLEEFNIVFMLHLFKSSHVQESTKAEALEKPRSQQKMVEPDDADDQDMYVCV